MTLDEFFKLFPNESKDDWYRTSGGGIASKKAKIDNSDNIRGGVVWHNAVVVDAVIHGGWFHGGEFHGGVFRGGEFHDGVFRGGEFHGGEFHGGEFHGGEFHDGVFHGGEFHDGVFHDGVFRGGEFHDGEFHGGWFHGGEFHGGVFHGGVFRGGEFHVSPLQIQGTRHFVNIPKQGHIQIGCICKTFDEWKNEFESIGKEHGYSEKQIAEYGAYIDLAIKLYGNDN